LKTELDSYKSQLYSGKDIEYTFSITGDATFTIKTLAVRVDINNCHAGSWRGDWKVDTAGNTMEGAISVHAYSHEDCNVQLQHRETFSPKEISDAASIRKMISKSEEGVQIKLDDLYATLGEKLKALRRVLPVTRTRLDWNVLSHRMVRTLEETTSQK